MKKIMMLALAAAMLCACAKNEDVPTVAPQPEDGAPVILTFGGSDQFTRAFFDNVAAAEPWEKYISTIMVYALDSEGNQVMRKMFSAEDIEALRTEFVVPGLTAGETLTFYALANMATYQRVMEEEDFYTATESTCYYYNASSFDLVTTSAYKEQGFSMSGKATATMNTDGSVTNVSITLKRFVAKIAVKIDIDPTFIERHHGGNVRVYQMNVESKAQSTPLFFRNYDTRFDKGTFSTVQYPKEIDGAFCGLFYLYEQGAPAFGPDEKPVIIIRAQYSQDGTFSPNGGNNISCIYRIELDGSGNGEIKRNGYYRISATITDIDALHTRSAVEISEWESPATTDIGDITLSEQ